METEQQETKNQVQDQTQQEQIQESQQGEEQITKQQKTEEGKKIIPQNNFNDNNNAKKEKKKKKGKNKNPEDDFEFKDEKHYYEEVQNLFWTSENHLEEQKKNAEFFELSEEKQKHLNFMNESHIKKIQQTLQGTPTENNTFIDTPEAYMEISGVIQELFAYGKQNKFIQLSDIDNVVQHQIIIKKKFWKGKHSYQDMCFLLSVKTVIQIQGYIGVSSFGKPSIYVVDFKVLDFPPPEQQSLMAITVFHYIKLYEEGVICIEFTQKLLHCKVELIELLVKEGRHLLDKYDLKQGRLKGMCKNFRGTKKSKQYKVLLEVVSKTIQGLPLGNTNQRDPKVPQHYQHLLAEYEEKYGKTFPVEFIDHGIKVNDYEQILQQNKQKQNQEPEQQQQIQEQGQQLQQAQQEQEEQDKETNDDDNKNINTLDILQFIPDQTDKNRVRYIENRKKPQVEWFLKQLHELLEKSTRKLQSYHFIDIGGGRGDLALSIAKEFPNCFVTVIDINDKSLLCGKEIAQQNDILNINFKVCGVQDVEKLKEEIFQEAEDILNNIPYQEKQKYEKYKQIKLQKKLDIVVGLHPCGGLSDALLELCIQNQCEFLVCTCCFCSNQFLVPESFLEAQKLFYSKEEDRNLIQKFAELQEIYPISERSMCMVNLVRMNIVKHMMKEEAEKYDLKILRFDHNFSCKNFVLQCYQK